MNSVVDVVPDESAQTLTLEPQTGLFLAGEAPYPDEPQQAVKYPPTFDAANFPLIQRILADQNGILLPDTRQEQEWRALKRSSQVCSWLGIPLIASHQTLGLLSLCHSAPDSFTEEHLRLAKSLAIPAAAAIPDGRPHQCAKIHGSGPDKRTPDLASLPSAPQRFQGGRPSQQAAGTKLLRRRFAAPLGRLRSGRNHDQK